MSQPAALTRPDPYRAFAPAASRPRWRHRFLLWPATIAGQRYWLQWLRWRPLAMPPVAPLREPAGIRPLVTGSTWREYTLPDGRRMFRQQVRTRRLWLRWVTWWTPAQALQKQLGARLD